MVLCGYVAFAQVQKCGLPDYRPKKGEGNMMIDTCNRNSYLWKGGTWYNMTNIIAETTPSINFTNLGIPISNALVSWYKPSTNTWYDVVGDAWRSRVSIPVDSLLSSHNRWTGKNTFADSLTAEKGIKSGSLIDTKGLKSTGTSTKSATEILGVQKDAVIEVISSTTLDGTYNTIVGSPSGSDIVLTLPAISSDNAGWKYTVSKKQSSSYNVRIVATGFNHVIISPNSPVVIRQRNGSWTAE